MVLSNYGVITRPPTDDDLHEYQCILLSDGFYWYPSNNLFDISSMEEEYKTISNVHRFANIFVGIITSTPLTIQCIDESGIHEFDRVISNVSIGLSQYLVVDIFVSNFRVRRTRIRCATYTDKEHHGISAGMLTNKWWLGYTRQSAPSNPQSRII